jgi:hypothetical protein
LARPSTGHPEHLLHADDALGNKMAALDGRALARDFLDIDAVLVSGRYSSERLLQLAETADPGFDRAMFADVLGALDQISDAAFAPYGVDASAIQGLRKRFADRWIINGKGRASACGLVS